MGSATAALDIREVDLVRDGAPILRAVTWSVEPDERWIVLGPNGSGKTSLLRIASLYEHPSRGTVSVAGETLGRTDVRRLRRRIGLTSPALGDMLRLDLTGIEVVMMARHAALEPWWHHYSDDDRHRARALLERFGVAHLAERAMRTASSGERQRVLLARAFAGEPAIVLLDEPTAGLDLGGREDLVGRLAAAAQDPSGPPLVLVTHHVEEIPAGTTHALLLRDGTVFGSGPVDEMITGATLSDLFGLRLEVAHRSGRYSARSAFDP